MGFRNIMRWRNAVPAVLTATVLTVAPAMAQQVGTATAVNPTSESTPPGGSTVTLNVGAHIVHKERIHTTPSGSTQILFNDKSSLSIAPNTNILIDEYVYNPNANSGHMLATLSEGALRYVGGKLSHQGEATIATPDATIGIRGGTATIQHSSHGTKVIDQFGTMTIQNNAGTITINRPGFEVIILGLNVPPGQPIRVSEAEIAFFLQLLTSKNGQNGGVGGLKTVTIGECGTGVFENNVCPNQPWMPNYGENNAYQTIIQGTTLGTQRIQQQQPPPPPRGR
jgi:hypothetical protein